MVKSDRIDNDVLREAGLALMRENGKPLSKRPSPGRSMRYTMPSGESVRVRTSNDHILIVVADKPTVDARLNIEGTDWLLIVMPEAERKAGNVVAYLVPTNEAVEAVHKSHLAWLSSNPNTKGENTTWNLWFGQSYSGMANRDEKHGYAMKWAKYRLEGEVSTKEIVSVQDGRASETGSIKAEVEVARKRIARAAAVSPEAVQISINFTA